VVVGTVVTVVVPVVVAVVAAVVGTAAQEEAEMTLVMAATPPVRAARAWRLLMQPILAGAARSTRP